MTVLEKLVWLFGILCVVILLPLVGAMIEGEPVEGFLDSPPQSEERQEPFLSPVSWVALAGSGVALVLLWFVFRRKPPEELVRPARPQRAARFPWWGWTAAGWTLGFWVLAWTRFDWFAPFQDYTFTPLWLGYIGVVNALVVARAGTCPATSAPLRYALLFPASALFWWVFEQLNRHTQNWMYAGAEEISATEYILHASVSFSVVLPAVFATACWLKTFPRLNRFLAAGPRITIEDTLRFRAGFGAAGGAVLIAIGAWPETLFPLLWVAPILVLLAWPPPRTRWTCAGRLGSGDWRWVGAWALAALVCGFFWEMWNYFSALKWVYGVPHFHALMIFEMPLLGYFGYLPFGVVCGMAVICIYPIDANKKSAWA